MTTTTSAAVRVISGACMRHAWAHHQALPFSAILPEFMYYDAGWWHLDGDDWVAIIDPQLCALLHEWVAATNPRLHTHITHHTRTAEKAGAGGVSP